MYIAPWRSKTHGRWDGRELNQTRSKPGVAMWKVWWHTSRRTDRYISHLYYKLRWLQSSSTAKHLLSSVAEQQMTVIADGLLMGSKYADVADLTFHITGTTRVNKYPLEYIILFKCINFRQNLLQQSLNTQYILNNKSLLSAIFSIFEVAA